jgi:hypothetical protein
VPVTRERDGPETQRPGHPETRRAAEVESGAAG